jgi:hypothetical protein
MEAIYRRIVFRSIIELEIPLRVHGHMFNVTRMVWSNSHPILIGWFIYEKHDCLKADD